MLSVVGYPPRGVIPEKAFLREKKFSKRRNIPRENKLSWGS